MPSVTRKIELIFYCSDAGNEPVREWLLDLSEGDRRAIGRDLQRVQYRWPIGMPLVRPMGGGLFEVRTCLASERIARVMFCFDESKLVALHGFIKKTERTPPPDIRLARRRLKEVYDGSE